MARDNEARVKFSADTTEFNKGIKNANSTITEINSALKLNAAQMVNASDKAEGYAKQQELLEQKLSVSAEKTEALRQKLEAAVKYFGENSEEAQKLRTQLNNAETAEEQLKTQIAACSNEMNKQGDEADDNANALQQLTNTINDQKSAIDSLKDEYANAVLMYGKNSDEAKNLKREIEELNTELGKNEKKLSDAGSAVKKFGDNAEEAADGGFTVLKGALADLASNALQAVIGKVKEFIDYLGQLPEATREFRQDIATLNTSFIEMGFSSATAKDTWKSLYAVFGEDDRAVEAANNISRMASDQEDLNNWVTITTGIWGTYQDSLPVEGLAEAAGETAKTGAVTGVLADALNWSSDAALMFAGYMSDEVTTAEDAFNVALSECTTEQERQALITNTLLSIYGNAADTYRTVSGAQMEAKEASAEQALAEADLANAIEPVTTAWMELKTELLTGMMPAIKEVAGAIADVVGWMKEHPAVVKAVAAALGVIAAAFTALTVAVVAQTVAQWALNSAILANPLTWVIVGITAAVAAIVAIIVLVIEYWDEIGKAVQNVVTAIQDLLFPIMDALAEAWANFVAGLKEMISQLGVFFAGVWESIKNAFVSAFTAIKDFLSALWESIKANPVVQWFSALFTSIYNTLKSVVDVIVELIRGVWLIIQQVFSIAAQWFNTNVITPIKNFFTELWDGVANAAKTAWSKVTEVWKVVSTWVNTNVVTPITTVFNTAWNTLKKGATDAWNGIKKVFSDVATFFGRIFGDAWAKVKAVFSTGGKIFSGIKDGIVNAFKNIVNTIIKGINKVVAIPFNAINKVLDKIRAVSILGIEPFKRIGSISVPQIPLLANGGILTKPTLNVAGEAGPEAVIPLDRLQGYVTTAVENASDSAMMQSLVNAIEDLADRAINLNVNGYRFATATASDTDSVNGARISLKNRGLAL